MVIISSTRLTVVEVDADDLRRRHRRQVAASAIATSRPSRGDQVVAVRGRRRRRCRRAGCGGSRAGSWSPRRASVGSAGGGQVGAAVLAHVVGVRRRTTGRGKPPSGRSNHRCTWPVPIEFSYSPYCRPVRGAVALAEGADHHQVVAEPRLGPVPVELRHGVQHPRVVAGVEPLDAARSSAARASGVKMCSRPAASWSRSWRSGQNVCDSAPEAISSTLRSDSAMRVAERAAEPQEVLGVGGLAHADADPALVGQALAEELPQVGGGVEDRQVVVVDRGDPGAVWSAPCRRSACASSGSPGKS